MTVRVRIAPSPTGNLHIGTARTAVFNWLFARHQGGQFILRIEDTDLERSKPEFTQNILDGLQWLGLQWDEGPVYQTQRLDLYQPKIQALLDQGLAYRAYETPAELDALREAQKARGEAPRYNNGHRNLTPEQQAAFEAEGRTAVIRFKIDDDREIAWNDLVRGPITWKGRDLGGDMVIARAAPTSIRKIKPQNWYQSWLARTVEETKVLLAQLPSNSWAKNFSDIWLNFLRASYDKAFPLTKVSEIGQPLYNFVVVVDDIDMGITHVVRGEDHIGNTPKQILLYEALGATVPEFGHTPLILNEKGAKLSKRDGVTSISDFQKMGYVAPALANYMTLLGWTPPDSTQEIFTLSEAAQHFSFDRVSKAGAKFDWDKLNWLNSQYLHALPAPELTDLLIPYWQGAGYECDWVGDRPWLEQIAALIGPSLARLDEAVAMTRYLFMAEVGISEEGTKKLHQDGSKTLLEAIAAVIPPDQSLTEATASALIKQVAQDLGIKEGKIKPLLRVALTGETRGPDLMQSWLLLHQKGWDTARLAQAIAVAS